MRRSPAFATVIPLLAASCAAAASAPTAAAAARAPSKAETAAIKRVALKACRRGDAPGPCVFRRARVSGAAPRYAWARVTGDGFSGALLKRPTGGSRRFRVAGVQGGGIRACAYWRARAPRAALRDLRVRGALGPGAVGNCGVPGTGGSGVVSLDGVGPLRFGVAKEADLVAFAGAPDHISNDDNPYSGQANVVYCYGFTGRYCRVSYGINRTDDVLANFFAGSKRFRTQAGSRVGTARRTAIEREPGRLVPAGCFDEHIASAREDGTVSLRIGLDAKRVDGLTVTTEFGGGSFWSC